MIGMQKKVISELTICDHLRMLMDQFAVEDIFSQIPRIDQIQSKCHSIHTLFPHACILLLLHQNICTAARTCSAYSSIALFSQCKL